MSLVFWHQIGHGYKCKERERERELKKKKKNLVLAIHLVLSFLYETSIARKKTFFLGKQQA